MPRKILAPHKEQDRWVYIRVWRDRATRHYLPTKIGRTSPPTGGANRYSDNCPDQRIISSRRVEEAVYQADRAREAGFTLKGAVNLYKWLKERGTDIEEAVETADFLKQLTSEGLFASCWPGGYWYVAHPCNGGSVVGTTLREAYYRYKAQAEEQPADDEHSIESEPMNDARWCEECVHLGVLADHEPCCSCLDADIGDDHWSHPYFKRAAR